MRLVYLESEESWAVQFDGKTVAIGGKTFFENRADAVIEISKRGLTVTDDGAISRTPVESLSEPETEHVSQTTQEAAAQAVSTAVSASTEEAVDEAPETTEDRPKGKRGRPRTYTPEEIQERRREQNRKYYHARAERRKAEVRERAQAWLADHPDKVREYRQNANEKRRERYRTDPDYRAKVDASNRAYQAKKRAAGASTEGS